MSGEPFQRLDTRSVDPGQRPTGKDYDSFLGLVELLEATGYEIGAYRERSPFCVHDVVIDAIWYRAAVALNEIASALGLGDPVSRTALEEYASAFESAHWNEELGGYFDVDLVAGRQIVTPTAAGPAALFGGFQRSLRARRCWDIYRHRSEAAAAVCTYPPGEPGFDPVRYWRGPVWIQVNWLVAGGLEACGLEEDGRLLRAESLQLVEASGFSEYFNSIDRTGCGSPSFSWTAALTLEWLAKG